VSDIEKSIIHKQKVVCALGMHRSGTSMTTRILNLMGVFLGKADKMVPAIKNENPEGFWEHIEIVNIHEEILRELDSSWESTKPLPGNWWELPNIKKYKIKMLDLVKRECSDVSIWGFKDPRTCIMLPLWKEIFEILDVEFMFIIPIRNPIDVANSLIKREGFSLNHSIRLWYYYMINILKETKDCKRIFIQYDDMIENIDLNLMKLMGFLDIDVSEENKKLIKESLKPNLRHSKTNQKELQLLANKQVVELYNICIKFIEDPYYKIDLDRYSCDIYKLYSDLMEVQRADKKMEVFISSLFIDYGRGYSEENSIKQRIAINENYEFNIHFELGNMGEDIKNLRWDPLEGRPCKCIVDSVLVNTTTVKIVNSNAEYSNENQFDFLTTDPICFLENYKDKVERVTICGKIIFYESFELLRFFEIEKDKVITINQQLNYCEKENNLLVEDKERIIRENENNLLIREKEISNTIQELENKYKSLLDSKIKSDEKLQLILNSFSWKITKPLRYIKRLF